MKVLLVEDEENIRGFIKINLKRNDFEVIEARTGEIGLEKAIIEKPEMAILDVMLPGIDGYEVCRRLRELNPNMGIIMLTAKGQDMDKIKGLEYGVDDYIVKPFNPTELVLRIKAIIRRVNTEKKAPIDNSRIILEPFVIDEYSTRILKNNVEIEVTPKEYLLLKVFMQNPDKAFTRDELLDLAWGENFFGDSKIIDVNIRRLRSKIEDNSSNPRYIQTVWGVGYRWQK